MFVFFVLFGSLTDFLGRSRKPQVVDDGLRRDLIMYMSCKTHLGMVWLPWFAPRLITGAFI